jgi:hypothetical protein
MPLVCVFNMEVKSDARDCLDGDSENTKSLVNEKHHRNVFLQADVAGAMVQQSGPNTSDSSIDTRLVWLGPLYPSWMA